MGYANGSASTFNLDTLKLRNRIDLGLAGVVVGCTQTSDSTLAVLLTESTVSIYDLFAEERQKLLFLAACCYFQYRKSTISHTNFSWFARGVGKNGDPPISHTRFSWGEKKFSANRSLPKEVLMIVAGFLF